MTKVFEHAQEEITKTKKFKILSLEINQMHRAIANLVEKGHPMNSMPVVTLEKQLCSLTRVRGWCLRKWDTSIIVMHKEKEELTN